MNRSDRERLLELAELLAERELTVDEIAEVNQLWPELAAEVRSAFQVAFDIVAQVYGEWKDALVRVIGFLNDVAQGQGYESFVEMHRAMGDEDDEWKEV